MYVTYDKQYGQFYQIDTFFHNSSFAMLCECGVPGADPGFERGWVFLRSREQRYARGVWVHAPPSKFRKKLLRVVHLRGIVLLFLSFLTGPD